MTNPLQRHWFEAVLIFVFGGGLVVAAVSFLGTAVAIWICVAAAVVVGIKLILQKVDK
jgi:small basic protein